MRLFISHIHEEYAVARSIQKQLDTIFGAMVDVFLSDNIKLGTDWLQEIRTALQGTDVILALFSNASHFRPWINIEAGYGIMSGKMVIPVCHRGLTKDRLPTIYGLRQALELDNRDDISKLLQTIGEATAAKRLLVPDLALVIHNWIKAVEAAEALTPPYVAIIGSPVCVWIIGSVNRLQAKFRKRAFKVADALADEFINRGYQVMSGRSLLLDYLGDRVTSGAIKLAEPDGTEVSKLLAVKSARVAEPVPNPVIILGSLSAHRGLRQLFMDTVGKIPDVAVVLGGTPGGPAVTEIELARSAGIAILPIKFTGGVAAETQPTFAPTLTSAVEDVINASSASDLIGRRIAELIEKQAAFTRANTPTAA